MNSSYELPVGINILYIRIEKLFNIFDVYFIFNMILVLFVYIRWLDIYFCT